MDKPSSNAYEVIQLFLELWERKKGEQAAMLARPSKGAVSSESEVRLLCGFREAEPGETSRINRR